MTRNIKVQNSLSRKKEVLEPINEGFIGMYVCGPTVYSDVHLGNCRTFVSFDVIYRYLLASGYKVRYVRNITDVGHLLDDGEDRMSKGAKMDNLEPMEVAQKYANGFHKIMDIFNTLKPSIEPRATGHIIEQIEMVQDIIDNGYGYERNGSVYFNTKKFAEEKGTYGQLSGRILDDLLTETRDLKNQGEKDDPADFAIWMKASDDHLMKWNSPWSVGFPGWHLECSAMSTKYLGSHFDIHGGGNDLKFPHHENEIAQNMGACSCQPAKYWLHTNMLLMNGKKMSKSDGNTISPEELFTGDSPHVSKGYSPMVVKFFFLQSHYGSPNDLTDTALQAAEKGYKRLMNAEQTLRNLTTDASAVNENLNKELLAGIENVYSNMDDDFNTPKAMASLFELVPRINSFADGKQNVNELTKETLEQLSQTFSVFIYDIFGLLNDDEGGQHTEKLDGLMDLILDLRQQARANKDWTTSDQIRDKMNEMSILIKDGKEGSSWSFK